jgi:YggT family protein
MNGLIHGINNIFNLFYFLIILRIFLSWIPNVDWFSQPWRTVREITDLYLNIFKRIIPPFGGLDFSPIIAIIALQIIQNVIIFALIKASA